MLETQPSSILPLTSDLEAPFSAHAAAMVVSHILRRTGGYMPVGKLLNLLYLVEREYIKQYGSEENGYRLMGGGLISLPTGPALVGALVMVTGLGCCEEWNQHLSLRGSVIELADPSSSPSGLGFEKEMVVDEVIAHYAHLDASSLSQRMRDQLCPEWCVDEYEINVARILEDDL